MHTVQKSCIVTAVQNKCRLPKGAARLARTVCTYSPGALLTAVSNTSRSFVLVPCRRQEKTLRGHLHRTQVRVCYNASQVATSRDCGVCVQFGSPICLYKPDKIRSPSDGAHAFCNYRKQCKHGSQNFALGVVGRDPQVGSVFRPARQPQIARRLP